MESEENERGDMMEQLGLQTGQVVSKKEERGAVEVEEFGPGQMEGEGEKTCWWCLCDGIPCSCVTQPRPYCQVLLLASLLNTE